MKVTVEKLPEVVLSASSATVGTVTANLSAVDNAVLDTIDSNTDSGAVVGNGAAATAQRVTLANDSTGVIATVSAVTAITNALPAGTNVIGQVHGGGISISVTPTITAGAYHAKDAVGGEMTFANAVRVAGGSGIINSVVIADNDDEKAGLELWLFSATVTEAADNAAMDFTDAEMLTCVGVIPISTSDYYSLADNGAAVKSAVGLQFKCASTSLFGQLKCTATPTYTAVGDLTVTLGIEYLN